MRYKWTILMATILLACLTVVMTAFFWGWSRLGLHTGFFVLAMIYGYIGLTGIIKAIVNGVNQIRSDRR